MRSQAKMDSEFIVFDSKLKEERDYWVERLSHHSNPPGLRPDYERSAEYVSKNSRVEVHLSDSLCQEIAKLVGKSPFLLYTTLVTALKVCLHRYGVGERLTVGSPTLSELGRSNAVVIVDDVSGDLTFEQLLLNVRQTLLDAYTRQQYPIGRLIKDLNQEGITNRCPLFDIAVALEDMHFVMPEVMNDITIIWAMSEDGISGEISYSDRLHKTETIERFGEHIKHALEEGLGDTTKRVREFELMNAAEREQVLWGTNKTEKKYPEAASLNQLFESQVEKTPDSVALICEDQQLTYAELNARANQLAGYLQAIGVEPNSLVGIYIDRTPEMVLGILAAMKTGAAYVPMDLSLPRERLAFMVQDTSMSVLLTRQYSYEDMPAETTQIVCLDSRWPAIEELSRDNLPYLATSGNLAYVMYTSGSTGKPKGVMIPHRGLVNYLNWCVEEYKVSEGRGAPLHSPIGFDLTVTSLFPPLITGNSVTLVLEDRAIDELTRELSSSSNFSLVKITPAHLELLEDSLSHADVANATRLMVIGGEALYGENIAFWRAKAHSTRIINEYGPTETVVGCCVYEVSDDTPKSGLIPIGKPISNTQIHLIDSDLRLVPSLAQGELYIGGDGLAYGYLNRPELTADMFLPNPFATEPGARLYRTGDLARRFADGNIEFMGRVDHQIKLRGFRIEPGEIQAVIERHPEVRGSLVILREDKRDDKRLVAYVVSDCERDILAGQLLTMLKAALPEYMVPAAFVVLDALPLTSNGKVDRRALPPPDQLKSALDRGYLAPRNPVEAALSVIWSDILGIERVGINDDFFELGGHSLLATKLMSRIRMTFQIEMPLSGLFDAPTISQFTRVLISYESIPNQLEKIAGMIKIIENMSDDDVHRELKDRERPHEARALSPRLH